jgi:hypothetical protein
MSEVIQASMITEGMVVSAQGKVLKIRNVAMHKEDNYVIIQGVNTSTNRLEEIKLMENEEVNSICRSAGRLVE